MRTITFLMFVFLISGCVSRVQISNVERDNNGNYYEAGLTKNEILDRGVKVGEGYLSLADQVASVQDGVSVFNILLASGAAIAVINDVSTDTLARIGVGGLAINQTTSYFNPVTARDSLTRAAKRNFCIVGVGRSTTSNNPEDIRILADALTRVKFFLRSDLNREPNNYSDLFAAQKAAIDRAKTDATLLSQASLQTEVGNCLALT